MDYIVSFGEWLRRRRTALNLTRAELADCAGCSVSALRKIETGERRPSRQLAERLAAGLRIPPEEQPAFVDAARGARQVARLGQPASVARLPSTRRLPMPLTPYSAPANPPPLWNLPTPATPLIGRETELNALMQLLDDPRCRLLTLLGPGGIGKTRLALEFACLVWDHFVDGVYFVELDGAASPHVMAPTIAQAIGLNFAGPVDPRRQLVTYLSSRQALLLLDNMEHLLAGADLLAEILQKGPGIKLLATSRERLQLQGEWSFEVQGLPAPAADEPQDPQKSGALQLFLQRARQTRLDFEPDAGDLAHIIRICRLVEGMPLAIEFAAAWVPVLSCAEIVQEIEHGLDILSTSLRNMPERQRSMRAVFDYSWQRLSPAEQQALARLAVFRGGFRREAAREVAGADLRLLSSLLGKSFLRRTSQGRFMLHDLVRQYLAGRLHDDPAAEEAAANRHAAYYLDYVARLEHDLKGARQRDAMAHMDAEADNIRRAWRVAVRAGNVDLLRRPLRALWCYYDARGWFREAHDIFCWAANELQKQQASAAEAPLDYTVVHAALRANQGWFALRTGRFEEAAQLLQTSVDTLRQTRARAPLVDALQHAGALDRLMGNYVRSRERYREMWQLSLQTADTWNATIAQGDIGLAAQALGDCHEAHERMTASVETFRALGDRRMLAVALHFLGGLPCVQQTPQRAEALLRESLALSRAGGDRWIENMSLRELGNLACANGAPAEAAVLLEQSLSLAREIGEHWSILQALNCLAASRLALDDLPAARAAFHEALVMSHDMQALPDILAALGGLALCATRDAGAPEPALQNALSAAMLIQKHPAATQQTRDTARGLQSELSARLAPAALSPPPSADPPDLQVLVAAYLAAQPAEVASTQHAP